MKRLYVLAVVAVLGVVSGYFARAAFNRNRQVIAQRKAVAGQRAMLGQQLTRVQADLATANTRGAEFVDDKPPPRTKAAGNVSTSVAASKPARSLIEWLQDPTVQLLYIADERALVAQEYGRFFATHHLTPVQVRQLQDLIAGTRINAFDLSEIHRTTGVPLNDSAIKAEREKSDAEFRAAVTAMLGEQGSADLHEYARTRQIWSYVAKVSGAATVDGCPLTTDKAVQLADALIRSTPYYAFGGPAEFSRIDWKTADTSAAAILSSEQLKLLHNGSPSIPSRHSSELSRVVYRALMDMDDRPTVSHPR